MAIIRRIVQSGSGNVWKVNISANVRRRLADVFGASADEWILRLPALVRELESSWGFRSEGEVWGNYSVVLPGLAGSVPACLKLVPPSVLARSELEALRIFKGRSAARVLQSDPARGAMLIERALPGVELTQVHEQGRDALATTIACEVMRNLPKEKPPPGCEIESTARRASGLDQLWVKYDGKTGPIPSELAERARGLFQELLASQEETVVIHGDLHHENILSSERGWLVIDPHGLVAEPCFETYALLRNPDALFELEDLRPITARRVDRLREELGYDRDRIKAWGFACAVLSAWWTIQDHGVGGENDIRAAEAIWAV